MRSVGRREYLRAIHARYQRSKPAAKGAILTERGGRLPIGPIADLRHQFDDHLAGGGERGSHDRCLGGEVDGSRVVINADSRHRR